MPTSQVHVGYTLSTVM